MAFCDVFAGVFTLFLGAEIWYGLGMPKYHRLWDTYRFAGFRPSQTVRGIFGYPKARVIRLHRRGKKRDAVPVGTSNGVGTIDGCAECEIWLAATPASTWSWKFDASPVWVAVR